MDTVGIRRLMMVSRRPARRLVASLPMNIIGLTNLIYVIIVLLRDMVLGFAPSSRKMKLMGLSSMKEGIMFFLMARSFLGTPTDQSGLLWRTTLVRVLQKLKRSRKKRILYQQSRLLLVNWIAGVDQLSQALEGCLLRLIWLGKSLVNPLGGLQG